MTHEIILGGFGGQGVKVIASLLAQAAHQDGQHAAMYNIYAAAIRGGPIFCTVLVSGRPILSCLALPVECEGREITTVEGLAAGAALHPLQQAFAELGSAQCGYCIPGFLLSAAALLRERPHPTRPEIAEATAGNLCRCTGYLKIFEAIELAAERMRPSDTERARG